MQLKESVDKGRYLACSFNGEVDIDSLEDALKRVHDDCSSRAKEGVILDLTSTTGTLTGLERFKLAMRVVPKWDRRIRIAIAIRDDQAAPGPVGQLFAQNRGRRVRVFTSLATATAWMEASFAPPTDDPT